MRPNHLPQFNAAIHTQAALAAIDNPTGEGKRAFIKVYRANALAQAQHIDQLRSSAASLSPLAGLTISIKDLFDVQGETTTAGSIALKDTPAALSDAPIVTRLKAAGVVIVGRTNMTEFAYGGVGMNVHYGTPAAPFERDLSPRIPGGSSSGAAVSVADGMAWGAIGSDTGGSTRIPAAFCGIVGFKPTQARISRDGAIPLSTTLDSIGPLAKTVADCALLDACMADEPMTIPTARSLNTLRIAVPKTIVFDALDPAVATAIERSISTLAKSGASITEIDMPEFSTIIESMQRITFAGAEAWAWHRKLIAAKGDLYDWRVKKRLLLMNDLRAADYIDLLALRQQIIAQVSAKLEGFDAMLMPTVPIIPPTIASLEADETTFFKTQPLTVRNCQLINFIDGCAISLPCHEPGAAPVGLMLASTAHRDHALFSAALGVEEILERR
jgi:aspartyl-tRNA(Asn)/glutamyl-tRNA(Gln) amidotransferase subunit A